MSGWSDGLSFLSIVLGTYQAVFAIFFCTSYALTHISIVIYPSLLLTYGLSHGPI